MDKNIQIQKDYELCKQIWRLFREYGDISINESDASRWESLIHDADIVAATSPESRKLASVAIQLIECRARNWNIST